MIWCLLIGLSLAAGLLIRRELAARRPQRLKWRQSWND